QQPPGDGVTPKFETRHRQSALTPAPCVPHPIPGPSRRCLRTRCPRAHTSAPAARTAPIPAALTLAAFRLQVKIWFQNKRSKFKKLLKQGSNPHESDPLPGSAALSPRSPALPPVWDVSASAKGVNMPPNSYMPGYSHWYSSPHQDTMQRPQMM
ncbi:homeobox protein DLX-6, partial [Meleagris gallopavo]|uniref:homeobox protein DLX-6 n=1 Tax=Meleagris gallopavo TaxID=9103 RepID=UPI00093DC3C9